MIKESTEPQRHWHCMIPKLTVVHLESEVAAKKVAAREVQNAPNPSAGLRTVVLDNFSGRTYSTWVTTHGSTPGSFLPPWTIALFMP
ncbi:hypothetical protein FRC02_003125 [Tulasnella sp. 418]|nr:hypothetical protein FRC02_003125 [Tulasnella sp. 418]